MRFRVRTLDQAGTMFAWFPVYCHDQWVWLERVRWVRRTNEYLCSGYRERVGYREYFLMEDDQCL